MSGGDSNSLTFKGSNFMRQRLVLSVLSGKPIKITDIRRNDNDPGLRGNWNCFEVMVFAHVFGRIYYFNNVHSSLLL